MTRSSLLLGSLSALFFVACGDDGVTPSGGAGGAGGSAGQGASGATGGAPGTGGGGAAAQGGGGANEGGSGTGGGAPSGRWVMGYYAGYEASLYPVDQIAWGSMTHIAVAFYLPQGDGTLDESLFQGPSEGVQLGHALVDAAHAHGVRAIASIGGAGLHDAFAQAASAPTRATFVANLAALVETYGYDGLDLDWEPVYPADEDSLAALASDLRAAIPGVELTIPVGYINANAPDDLGFYAQYADRFDQINLMTYGMAGAWDGWKSWHSSALHHQDAATPTSVESSIQAYLDAGVPAAKLGVGAGFYGLCYSAPVSAPDQPLNGADVVANDGTMSYAHIMASYFSQNAAQWDAVAHVPYLSFGGATGPAGCTYVSYEDPQSLADKGDWIVANGLGGAIIWTIGQGYLPAQADKNPLLDALHAHVAP
ncbi:MAG: glycoside hydrolase family 18 protein [Polyangiaceae bacterium]